MSASEYFIIFEQSKKALSAAKYLDITLARWYN